MKKATILHTEASNGWGGQEIRVLNEMLGMERRGYEMLLASPPGANISQRAAEKGIRAFPVRMDRPGFVRGVLDLAGIIRECKVSIINTHSSRDSWIGSLAGRLTGIKVLRTRHLSSALNKGPLTRLIYGRLCDGVLTTGEFIRGRLVRDLRLDPRKVRSIPTGIEVERFESANGGSIRAFFDIPPASAVLGIAAVLRSWKGHLDLLKAMPGILAAHPGAKLMIVGDGPRRARIQREINSLGLGDAVILTGYREDIPEIVNAFDLAVMASYASEGIPQFALQAMAAGKPIVATRVGGIPEVVLDGVNGLLVEPENHESLSAAVTGLLGDSRRMKEMGEAGHKMALERHSLDAMLDRIEVLYGDLLRRPC